MDIDGQGNIVPSRDRRKNIINNGGVNYRIQRSTAKSGYHSSILEVMRDDQEEIRIIKVCKYANGDVTKTQKIDRFQREIQALRNAYTNNMDHIIRFDFSGSIVISGKTFDYYVMEKALGGDLKHYIYKTELDTTEKLRLCVDILKGIKQLHDIGIYHRDIKPQNILLVSDIWKIADLGLIALRGEDHDSPKELIGPVGWLSPEATNKYYTNGRKIGHEFDCVIDERSDIFQLGKLFWFIFQGNVPIGQLKNSDFRITDKHIFEVLELMLQHDKQRRPNLDMITTAITPIARTYSVI